MTLLEMFMKMVLCFTVTDDLHQENRHLLLGQGYATEPKLGLIGHHMFCCSNIGLVRSQ